MPTHKISSPICELFGIQHPVILAGMNAVAGPDLAAAVTNAGGLGVVGGVGYTPKFLRSVIAELKEELDDPNAPFGIDLLLPQVGGSARKTNYDYTGGKLPELIDIIVESGAKLFVSSIRQCVCVSLSPFAPSPPFSCSSSFSFYFVFVFFDSLVL